MKVTCAICGFTGLVTDFEGWNRHGASLPKVFLCDTHSYYTSRVLLLDPFDKST